VANRLAMSESDLYRKQRVAIKEVARTLARMEEAARVGAGLKPVPTDRPLAEGAGGQGTEASRQKKAP